MVFEIILQTSPKRKDFIWHALRTVKVDAGEIK